MYPPCELDELAVNLLHELDELGLNILGELDELGFNLLRSWLSWYMYPPCELHIAFFLQLY
jgi:hypothetical protein